MTIHQSPEIFQERNLLLAAFARGVRPRPIVSPSEWGEQNFIVPVGPLKGEKFDLQLTPYLREPLDMLRADSPWTEIAVKKSEDPGCSR